ncbi:MAG: hypothetical protein AB1898_22785 [Acidobacteriota bacterium]
MRLFGKSLGEYFEFQKVILGFVLLVGVARLALSLGGAPVATVKWLSLTVASLIGLILYGVRAHTRGFGSYKQLLPLSAIQGFATQALSALAVAVAIITATDNIFSLPEYSGGSDGKVWFHAGAHLFIAFPIVSLFGWGISSLALLITRKVAPRTTEAPAPPKSMGKAAGA